MASLLRIRGKGLALLNLRTAQSTIQALSSSGVTSASDPRSDDGALPEGYREEWPVPMVPKRDPDAVLKALASTVEPVEVPLYVRGRNIADPLYPRGRGYHMTYVQHMEAGRAAARTIIDKWPSLFPRKQTDPDPAELKLKGKSYLERLIIERKASEAWNIYRKLKEKGKKVPLSIQNDLLALVAYEGLGNTAVTSEDLSDVFVNWPREKSGTQSMESGAQSVESGTQSVESGTREEGHPAGAIASEEAVPDNTGGTKEQAVGSGGTKEQAVGSGGTEELDKPVEQIAENRIQAWSMSNIPEEMFSEMEQKDGRTYDALIQGLVKFNRYGRAFAMFQEMRDKGFQASRGAYHHLLSTLKSYNVFNIARSLVKHMSTEPVVEPDITTMNHLLRICSKMGDRTKVVSLKLMREIFHLGLEPTLTTFYYLLTGLASDRYGVTNKERAEVLEQVVEYIQANQQVLTLREETDMVFFLQAFSTAEKIESADLAMRLKALAETNHNFLVDNLNLVSSKYLVTIVRNAPLETAIEEYHKLVPKSFVPLEWLYGEMFVMCDKHQSAETALKLWQHTQRFRVPLRKVDTWNSFCRAVCHRVPQEGVETCLLALEQVEAQFKDARIKPSDTLLTAMVRAHTLNNNLSEAWIYYNRLKSPSFLALVALLKKHNSLGERKKTVEILEEMIRLKMHIPLRFAKDILWSSGLDEQARHWILDGLAKNKVGIGEERLMKEFSDELSEDKEPSHS